MNGKCVIDENVPKKERSAANDHSSDWVAAETWQRREVLHIRYWIAKPDINFFRWVDVRIGEGGMEI